MASKADGVAVPGGSKANKSPKKLESKPDAPSPTVKKRRMDHFFAPKKSPKKAAPANDPTTTKSSSKAKTNEKEDGNSKEASSKKQQSFPVDANGIPLPIIPVPTKTPPKVMWAIKEQGAVMIRKDRNGYGKTKAAAIDLDGTLLLWKTNFFPSQLSQYELWNNTILIPKLRQLSDDGYQLIVVSNQGGIRTATSGKTAQKIQAILNWLQVRILQNRPLWAILSTQSKSGLHKPSPRMWTLLEAAYGTKFDIANSLYVGDSDGVVSDDGNNDEYRAKGVDREFAENVAQLKGGTLQFYHPGEFFGPSNMERRMELARSGLSSYTPPPARALDAYAAFLGGYLNGPICLVLCGAQGSGKSTFGEKLLQANGGSNNNNNDDSSNDSWVVLAQDTINKGKPGKREAVEEAARQALSENKSVAIDRMHLDATQRSYFIELAQQVKVPVHAVVLSPPPADVVARVRQRTNHPGNVQGDDGAKLASASIQKMALPDYEKEAFDLIHVASSTVQANDLAERYGRVQPAGQDSSLCRPFSRAESADEDGDVKRIPRLVLGTMKLGKRVMPDVLPQARARGLNAVDTAPTYNNETDVGRCIDDDTFVIAKVPKRAVQAEQVRKEFMTSKKKLGRVDLLMLHWPCDIIENDTLESVWKEMEQLVEDKECRMLGVANFTVDALRTLLPLCKVKPVVNQVECHPLFPQWKLLNFCSNQGIQLQAHTPLGQGKSELLEHPVVSKAASSSGLSAASVVILWNLQRGVSVVPKCSSEEHLEEVTQTEKFLSPNQMKALDTMGQEESKRFVQAPFMKKSGAVYSW